MKKMVQGFQMLLSISYLLLLILLIVASLYQRFFSSVVEEGKYQARAVIGGSMVPTIPIGSLVISEKTPKDQLKIEDIIVFAAEHEIVTHRIKRISQGEITTKGDANDYEDFGGQDVIKGKVLLILPKLGYFFLMIQSIQGKIALVSTIINLLLFDYFIRLLWIEWSKDEEGVVINESEEMDVL